MVRNLKSLLLNLAVSLLLLSSSAFFGWKFYTKLNSEVENSGGIEVGKVAVVQGQAERRYERQTRWGSVKGNESVYNLDAIRTSSESGAVIELIYTDTEGFDKRDEITLGPDTYIVLDLLGETRNIQFVGGDISATGTQGLTVSAGDTIVSVDGGSVNLGREEGRETSITVTRGEARVNTLDGETIVNSAQALRIDEGSGIAEKQDVAVNPLLPRNNALLLTYGNERVVDFSWDLFADWDNPNLEVSDNASFDEGISPVYRSPGNGSATMTLAPSRWFWRVTGGDSGESGPVSLFTLDIERPALPLSPADETVIPFRGETPSVNLQWQKAYFADTYSVELGRSREFGTPLVSREAGSGSILIEGLDVGQWWWRIKPIYRRAELDAAPSVTTGSFTLERRTGHDPPKLVSPADDMSFSALDVRGGIDFRWQTQRDLINYRIEVARDERFSDPVAVSEAPENYRKLLTAPEPGTYFWRVSATSADGLPVPISSIRNFTIRQLSGSVELIDPTPGDTRELAPFAPHTFVWRSGVPGTARFQLQRILDSGTGERIRIIESLVKAESFTAPLPGEGTYAWRVQILDDGGRMIVESPEAVFRLRSEFRSPVLNTPNPGSAMDLVGSTNIILGWDPAPGADAYRVIIKGPEGSVIGRDDRVIGLEREFPLPAAAGIGEYSVELSSLRNNPPSGASGESAVSIYRFRVENLVRYAAAVPTAPADGSTIGALRALRDGVTLTWRQTPPLGRWTVELDNGRVTRLYRTTEPRLVLEGLDAGTYRWLIRSDDGLGQKAPDSRSSGFTIAALPAPAAPRVTSPLSGENRDMTGRDSLVFQWEAVDSADFYDLALYAEGSGSPLMRETGLTDTRYVLTNLRILDVGNFILSIRARSEYVEAGITKTSTERRVPFSLSLNITGNAPKILTDELQYAE